MSDRGEALERTSIRATWVLYAVLAMVHLAVKASGWVEADRATKPLLVPALLLVAVVTLVADRRRGARTPVALAVLLAAALVLSWIGDLTVAIVIVGLGFFLAAHLAYSAAFLVRGGRRRPPLWTVVYAVWWVALMAVLAPSLGALTVPVAVYGAALGAMAVIAARAGVIGALGGAAFVVSDSLLALRLFTPALQGRAADVLIMLLYLVAQPMLVHALLRERRANRATEAGDGEACAMARADAPAGRGASGAGARIRIGISGWVYPPWRGVFYPTGLRQADELAYASERMTSIEINGSFYSLQRPASWRRWHDATPEGFVFAVKGPRYVTHLLRLRNAGTALANFFASGVLALGPKLGPVLWQLPPRFAFDPEVFDRFLASLPSSTGAALHLARSRDVERMTDRTVLSIDADRPLRHAVEVRDTSFDDPRMRESLRRHGVAAVLADTAGRYPVIDEDTADFRYVRLHGDTELYTSGYDDAAIERWAARTSGWASAGEDVYAYFDNDVKVRSPVDAMALIARTGR